MAKLLCVEDSPEFSLFLSSVLKDHSVVMASDLKQALALTEKENHSFDLIILDISLPDGNALKILPKLKDSLGANNLVPIIILSADSDIITKVAAFGVGADDFMSKPPDPAELRARIEARLRVARSADRNKTQFQIGDLLIDSNTMRVEIHSSRNGFEILDLTPSEFKILKVVTHRPGQVYSRDQLIDHVWGTGKYVTPRTVDAHVSNLRKKLIHSRVQIETVTGLGYKAIIQDTKTSSDSKI